MSTQVDPAAAFLATAAAGFSTLAALPARAGAAADQPPPKPPRRSSTPSPSLSAIEVNARPIPIFEPRDRSRTRFGQLPFRSGLVLTSPYRGFGGLSGLRLDAKGERFLAISDQGAWFTGSIRYTGGKMIGLDDVEAAPMLNPEGRPITEKRLVRHRVARARRLVGLCRARARQPDPALRFRQRRHARPRRGVADAAGGAQAALQQGARGDGASCRRASRSAGTLIAFSERGLDADGNLIAFLIGGPSPGQFSDPPHRQFRHQRCRAAAVRRAFILERKFSWFTGINIRIRSIPLKSIAPGALVDGPSLFDADLGHEVDNMEGIDAHVTPEGETV